MLRRLHDDQPDSFAFTPANLAWAGAQIKKYPEGRQASAIIPLLWRAQEQEGWLTQKAIEAVADMLGMAYIRALEVATFYFMFQLSPVGSVAHIQVCGTLSCMLCGGEELRAVCKEMIAPTPFTPSPDGKFSWEEVECLGACTNAPMVQIGKDFYEDLTAEKLREIIAAFTRGEVPVPGPQNGRYAAEPRSGLTALKEFESGRTQYNASVSRALLQGDTIARIKGDEVPDLARAKAAAKPAKKPAAKKPAVKNPAPATSETGTNTGTKPAMQSAPADGKGDDLKAIKGVGPALEKLLHEMGVWQFAQIAAWSADEIAWVDQNLARFKGRVSRDNWIEQAKTLASGGETEFSKRVAKGDVY